MNSLLVTLFLNELDLICLHTIQYFKVLLSNTDSFICTQLNGFKYLYLTHVILFNINGFKYSKILKSSI